MTARGRRDRERNTARRRAGDRERNTRNTPRRNTLPATPAPAAVVIPSPPESRNARVRSEGRLRPVVSLRMEPKTLAALDDIALARPWGWDKRPWPRTMLIEEAIREYVAKHSADAKRGHAMRSEGRAS